MNSHENKKLNKNEKMPLGDSKDEQITNFDASNGYSAGSIGDSKFMPWEDSYPLF